MAKINLTAGRIRDFATDKAQAFLWDADAPGLGVRATKAGNKAFVFQGRIADSDARLTIGDCRTWGIDEARKEARRLQTLIDKGVDPRTEKIERLAVVEAKRAEARRKDVTVAEAWSAYIAARRPKWSARHLRDHENLASPGGEAFKRGKGTTVPGPLAPLMNLPLANLTPDRVSAWLDAETAHRPTTTSLSYRLLRAFLRWCAGRPEFAAANVAAVGSRVAKDHLPRARAKESDCLQREQLAPWFAAVRQLGNPVIAAYLMGLLITGARREELAGLKWADVDFQWKSLSIRDKAESSGGEDGTRIIPLTPYLAILLAGLPRRNEWVFSSPTAESGRLQEPRIGHNQALKAAGLPHLSIHGLRRSFGTLAEWVECPTGVVAQIQGHKPSAIAEKHYRRRPLDLLRMWHTRIEAWMLEQAGIAQPAENTQGLRVVANNSKKAIA